MRNKAIATLTRTTMIAVVVAGALSSPSAALAAVATGTFQVTANVTATCLVSSTSNVAFGAYDTTAATNLQQTGSVSVRCTKNTAITSIDLDLGANASGATRRMTNGTDFIAYELYKPASAVPGAACAYTSVWGTGAVNGLVPAAAPNNAARTFNVCGQTTQGQDVGAGNYADTVTVTVNY